MKECVEREGKEDASHKRKSGKSSEDKGRKKGVGDGRSQTGSQREKGHSRRTESREGERPDP